MLYEKWKDRSEDEYRSWLKVWNNDRYKVASCDAGYYLTEKDARRALDVFAGDLNEGGSNEYYVLHSYPIGVIYPSSLGDHFYLFRYNRDTDEYLEVSWTAHEKYRYIMHHFTDSPMPLGIADPCVHGWRRKETGNG